MHYVTGGESHGPALTAIVSGVPAGLIISEKQINADLARRQSGYGRGGRQKRERDEIEKLSGVRDGKTLGSPLAFADRCARKSSLFPPQAAVGFSAQRARSPDSYPEKHK